MIENLTDFELIQKCLDNEDKAAWEAFVRRYSKLIWNTIHKTFHTYSFRYSNEDTEDMYSSAFLSLIENDFKKLRQFRRENACTVSTYLTIITSRMTIDYMRKDKGRFMIEPIREDGEVWEKVPDGKFRPDELVEKKQVDESLKRTIDSLSPKDGMIYDLLYNKGISPEDAAKTLGLTVSAVYTRKHRIIEKIKKNMKGM